MKGETGLPSYERLPILGMMVNGNYLIQGILDCPITGKESILLDILEPQVDHKYFLSKKRTKGHLIRRFHSVVEGCLSPYSLSPCLQSQGEPFCVISD